MNIGSFNFEPFLSEAQKQLLSSTVYNALTAFEALPALTAFRALSAVPKHPYDFLKYKLFGPDYKDHQFKNINDIPMPENLTLTDAYAEHLKTNKTIQTTLMHNLTCDNHLRGDLLTTFISGDKIVPNTDKQKQQVEFVEMVKQMDLTNITPDKAHEYVLKITSEYFKMYN
jgi:hypothetical protein